MSENDGRSWSAPIVLSDDGASEDLGYPSTVQLSGGSSLTVWYQKLTEHCNAVLCQATWKL